MSDTISAVATSPGLSGVAVVRVSGPDAWEVAARLTRRPLPEANRAVLRSIYDAEGTLIDHALVIGFKAPKSYTGEDTVEFQSHGGIVTPKRILEATFGAGARLARRGEFTERAFLNGKMDLAQAEAVLDLIEAKTPRAADAALKGLDGEKTRAVKALYEHALEISSTLEHALDVSEEELPESFYPALESQIARFDDELALIIRMHRESRLLRDGALVVLAGAPNAGKSSLMNALLNENRAIVSATPGTTRDAIEAWLDLGGYPVRLVDTAGLRETENAIEAEGVRRSEELIARADVVLGLDCEKGIRVHSKCDLGHGEGINVSSKTGEGLSELKAAIIEKLETWAPPLPDPTLAKLLEISTLMTASVLRSASTDIVPLANQIRVISEKLALLIGATYSEDLLDRLFSRFCVGK